MRTVDGIFFSVCISTYVAFGKMGSLKLLYDCTIVLESVTRAATGSGTKAVTEAVTVVVTFAEFKSTLSWRSYLVVVAS